MLRTLRLPEISRLRSGLVSELSLFGRSAGADEVAVDGIWRTTFSSYAKRGGQPAVNRPTCERLRADRRTSARASTCAMRLKRPARSDGISTGEAPGS